MEGARFLALLLYFEGRGAIAPLKREALLISSSANPENVQLYTLRS